MSTAALEHLLATWGYLAVFLFVAVESSGIPFPGETMLILAGVYAGTGHLAIPGVIASAVAGAIMGDNAGYIVGRTGGRQIALRWGSRFGLGPDKLAVAERFFARHGDKTVFLGRFVAVLRAWAAFLAGVNRMPWHIFVLYNAAGGILWATLYGLLAFELGKNLALLDTVRKAIGYGGLALAIVVVVLLLVLHRRATRLEHRAEAAVEQAADQDREAGAGG